MGVGDTIVANGEAAERSEVGAGAKFSADVFGEGADIGAGAAMDTDGEVEVIVI